MTKSNQTISGVIAGRKKLSLGSGNKKQADAVNIDIVSSTEPDLCHNLNRLPWPLPNDWFEECTAYDVIEHLDDIVAIMEEIHRVCRHGAIVRITVPHFSCANAYTDPTHRHYFTSSSFHYFTGDHEFSFYTKYRFKRRANRIMFAPTIANKIIRRLADRFPSEYERRWAWTFPAWFLYFELEVIKEASQIGQTSTGH
jgi:SAM-dependent methyltransferase